MHNNKLHKISVIGMGLLGGSLALAISRRLPQVEVVGYAHRVGTRRKVQQLGLVTKVTGDLAASVVGADMVILATPLSTFVAILQEIGPHLTPHCMVTDVGSTKTMPHRWARAFLPKGIAYVGSHPMAGSEQQGVDYARDDLFEGAVCLVTRVRSTPEAALERVEAFWQSLGCTVKRMSPTVHDKAVAAISHVPHAVAVSLVNAAPDAALTFAGKGFMDTSRIASGPANVWADIFLTNGRYVTQGIDRLIRELGRLRDAVAQEQRERMERLLNNARRQRAAMINEKLDKKELLK